MNIDDDNETTPQEVWIYLVDRDGERLTNEQPLVMVPGEGGGPAGTVGADASTTFKFLDGMEDREPMSFGIRFADGHVLTSEVPDGGLHKWEQGEE